MRHIRSAGWYMLFTVPLLFVFTTVVLVPFITGIGYAFFTWDGLPLNPKIFAGLSNFIRLGEDLRFRGSAAYTVIFTVLSIVTINVLGLAFALIVTTGLKVRNAARTMLFAPYMIGGLILGYVWKFILGEAFKSIGEMTGLTQIFFNWLLDPKMALMGLSAVTTWQMAGYIMIIYITGIQSIPDEVIEAAHMDGAGFWTTLFKIRFPLIMQSFTICLFLSLSYCFKIFDVNLSLTGGGPYNSTELFAMNIYHEIFFLNNYGYGQAKAIVFFIIVAVVTTIQVSITKRQEVEMK
ncbi:MAG: sugar ABC transporter permease [Spirochaetaceae bacterium]|jgi:raffinose/stachyose/melibiose transport system permease protein|nr:sugar ABC transporter permease [Spirochaetaceae bacterium]